jgi:transposase
MRIDRIARPSSLVKSGGFDGIVACAEGAGPSMTHRSKIVRDLVLAVLFAATGGGAAGYVEGSRHAVASSQLSSTRRARAADEAFADFLAVHPDTVVRLEFSEISMRDPATWEWVRNTFLWRMKQRLALIHAWCWRWRLAWMARPYSNDLRERVVAAVAAGQSCRVAIAVSSVVKWSQRYRATGSVAPGKIGGHRRPVLEPHRAFIAERIKQISHLTLHRLKDELAPRGVTVSHNAIWQFMRREGLSFKKTLFALEQSRVDITRRRARWKAWQDRFDPKRLVFIDETWIKTNMAPLRGWGRRGKRLHGFAPHGRWRTLTFLGTLRCDRFTAPCVFDGPINGECFRAYVSQLLVPTLKPGDIVILDNLGSHKSKAVRDAVKAAGARLWFLPKYSPDLNPIEQAFAISSIGCDRLKREPSRTLGAISVTSSAPSAPTNATTTSQTQDTLP